MTIHVWPSIVTTTCLLLLIPVATSANGPLRVHPDNPRYFTDAAGEAIYLTGLHTWVNVQDGGREFPPPKFNYDQYLDLLEEHNHNFTRLWVWESAVWRMPNSSGIWIDPLPFQRTGPGKATDGRQKFDLTRFNDEFFERVRARAIAAGDRGIYAGIMLFQGFSVSRKSEKRRGSPWTYHPLNRANNVNGVDGDPDGDGEGYETHELQIAEVTRIQEAYVRKMIDTVNDLDNVIFEIGNELHGDSTPWQYHMIEFIQRYERGKPRYECLPVGFYFENFNRYDRFDAYDVRQAAWWSILAGACGHTYGNNNIWQMWEPDREPYVFADIPWRAALDHPGAFQIGLLGRLLQSRPWHLLKPCQQMIVNGSSQGGGKIRAALAADHSFAVIYSPRGEQFTLRHSMVGTSRIKVIWFDPRYGSVYEVQNGINTGFQTYRPPTSGRGNDWVLILEDTDKEWPLPKAAGAGGYR